MLFYKIVRILLFFSCVLVLSGLECNGQITIDNNIEFTSIDSTHNQVINHASPIQENNALSASTLIHKKLSHSQTYSYSNNILHMNMEFPISAYEIGMSVSLVSNFTSQDSIRIAIDNGDTLFINKDINVPLDSADIVPTQVVQLIYDGASFVFFNKNYGCPSGFIQVNNNYCIQINESGPMTIYEAMAHCDTFNSQLCTFSDWYYACQDSSLDLQDMTNNWEWINHGNDHTSDAAVMGGSGVCESIQTNKTELWQGANTAVFRCCFYK